MNIKSLSAGLSFRGNVTGRRQKYYVFEGKDSFFVFSFSRVKPKSGYFNMVSSDAVTHVQRLTTVRVANGEPQKREKALKPDFPSVSVPPLATG